MKPTAQEIQWAINWLEEGINNDFKNITGQRKPEEEEKYGPSNFGAGFVGYKVSEKIYKAFYETNAGLYTRNKAQLEKVLRILKILQKETK